MTTHRAIAGGALPPAQGLYDPRHEHDACGIGVVADIRGVPSNDIIRRGLELLDNLSHRGAVGCDPCTGDGAGMLLQLPDALLRRATGRLKIALPEPGAYGVMMCFVPLERAAREACDAIVANVLAEERLTLLGWREVPVLAGELGDLARATAPGVRQAFVGAGHWPVAALERRLYIARRRIENAIAASAIPSRSAFYVASASTRTIVYKGLLLPEQLPRFYADLAERDAASALAIVHSRFSTNTFPTWARAHPYRYLCHNGEINTLRGNVNWMRVREGRMASELFGNDLAKLYPVVGEDQSDSACLDNALEFLVQGGRSLPHAMMMLIPEAWSANAEMDLDRRGFYEYHAAMMEPWDGPAAVAFTDGIRIGATLDRNGLRPARWLVTTDGLAVLASEAGALEFPADRIAQKGRLQPGKMFLVDTERGRVVEDEEVKREISARKPYRQWVASHRITIDELPEPLNVGQPSHATLRQRQLAFGYTVEELKMVLTPMAVNGEEPVGSMGTDTPLAVLSDEPRLLFDYFKQLFAQVTNPPIDPIREKLVMSLAMSIGPKANLLGEQPEHAHRIRVSQPILTNAELAKLLGVNDPRLYAKQLEMLWDVTAGPDALREALDELCAQAVDAIHEGYNILVLSDRAVDEWHAPIPSLLATSAVHHHLIRERLRTEVGLVVETGEARDVTHFALLIGYGAGTVNPYLAFETLTDLARAGWLPEAVDEATAHSKYIKAVGKGLLKIFSKMGISTIQSYCGAQVFEAIGLGREMIDRYFTGTASRIGGIGLDVVGEESRRRHARGFARPAPHHLEFGGEYHYRFDGEAHAWNPNTISLLQQAARTGSWTSYRDFARASNDERRRPLTLRGMLEFKPGAPIPIEDVEPASEIVKRFTTGAMSFGSLSKEAHETLALAMNRIGGRSNSGEGGEEPERYGTDRNSAIKQVASGRFGVTTEYLVNARELQIKMAQGAKPGEGGQLPGHKVDEVIARTRHSTPGVTLISPPPHHDIYSIEDLKQLIYDLKCVNPQAAVTVKLVAEAGVGTVAAGVAKAHADLILISGDSGGTGASPLSSIKHAGIPWELGLAETQQTLVLNDLRSRVRLQTDGQLKTGRDVLVAAMLGAEEFGFSTAPLIVAGCVMMRKCHLNTCPVGIATQDPVLRKKFTGQPEHIIEYFFFVAEEVRELLASIGARTMAEVIGRADLLHAPRLAEHWKARSLDLSPLLHVPEGAAHAPRFCVRAQEHGLESALDHELLRLARPALEWRAEVNARFDITNTNRTVGAMLSGEIARRFGGEGLPPETIRYAFTGSAGQSFGAFLAPGVSFHLEGETNDYLGKGMSGGRIVIVPPRGARFDASSTIIAGNVALYGATAGELFLHGAAGERFAVRNSGAVAVVEGVGDHGCEYMTGGTVVVLGKTGRNFAAGMSGGLAFVLDEAGEFERRCNLGMVELSAVESGDEAMLWQLVSRHAALTGSRTAQRALERWDEILPRFVRVISVEYRKILEQRDARTIIPILERAEHGRPQRLLEDSAPGPIAASDR